MHLPLASDITVSSYVLLVPTNATITNVNLHHRPLFCMQPVHRSHPVKFIASSPCTTRNSCLKNMSGMSRMGTTDPLSATISGRKR